ncbi:MAG: TrmH family RNA methyltransferase, partial [Bacteroidales bacterium]
DECIEIPQFGTKHSLNVSVSAGIVLWEAFRQIQNFR